METFFKLSWTYWFVTTVLLTLGIFVWPEALLAVIILNAVQSIHVLIASGKISAFPSQVRVAYLGLLIIGMIDGLAFIHWMQLVGSWAMILFDYCPLARILSLMPWNRSQPFSWDLVRMTALTPPVKGNILHGLPPQ
ncbi:MAG: hypothetical protein OEW37_08330 [Rhodospirillaceae bacterium]|nr:hypothetical protein [Rhodospirillaceae bacterium]